MSERNITDRDALIEENAELREAKERGETRADLLRELTEQNREMREALLCLPEPPAEMGDGPAERARYARDTINELVDRLAEARDDGATIAQKLVGDEPTLRGRPLLELGGDELLTEIRAAAREPGLSFAQRTLFVLLAVMVHRVGRAVELLIGEEIGS